MGQDCESSLRDSAHGGPPGLGRHSMTSLHLCARCHRVEYGVGAQYGHSCDTPIPGVPLTTCQPVKYSWMLSNPILHHRVPFFRDP